MKFYVLFLAVLQSGLLAAQKDSLPSAVYAWNRLHVDKTATGERRNIMEGNTTLLSYLEIHATTIEAGKAPHAPHQHPEEEFIIIKEGSLKVTIKDSSWILGPGSIAVMMPGDMHGFVNAGDTRATYYVIKSKSKADTNGDRGKNAGGSFVINANDIAYKENPKGGRKQYFERATAMMQRLEMHQTTLNESIRSHDPHTHVAGELMIVTNGNADIQIGEAHYNMFPGDLVLLNSGVLHAPKNNGKGSCTYFAIQFQ